VPESHRESHAEVSAKVPYDTSTAMIVAAKNGDYEAVKLLLLDPGSINPSDSRNSKSDSGRHCNNTIIFLAIRWASENGHHTIVELLLKDHRVSVTPLCK
jgi:hypothetical protein